MNTTKTQKNGQTSQRTLLLFFLSIDVIVACGTNDWEEVNYNPATKILRVEMTPDTFKQNRIIANSQYLSPQFPICNYNQ